MASNPSGGLVPSRRSLSPHSFETLKDFVQSRLAQVAIDEEDSPADLRQGQRQVAGHGGLAFPRAGAGERDDARPVAVLAAIQNGGQGGAEGIGKRGRSLLPGDQLHRALPILFFGFPGFRAPGLAIVGEAAAACRIGRGDDAQFGHVEIERGLAGGLDAAVGALAHDDEDDAEKAAGEQAEYGVQEEAGLIGPGGRPGGIDDAHIAGVQRGGDAGFLDVLEHGVVKLAVVIHLTLEDVVVRHLGGLLGHDTGLGVVAGGEQFLAALGGLEFVLDAAGDIGALGLPGGFQGRSPAPGPFSRMDGRG